MGQLFISGILLTIIPLRLIIVSSDIITTEISPNDINFIPTSFPFNYSFEKINKNVKNVENIILNLSSNLSSNLEKLIYIMEEFNISIGNLKEILKDDVSIDLKKILSFIVSHQSTTSCDNNIIESLNNNITHVIKSLSDIVRGHPSYISNILDKLNSVLWELQITSEALKDSTISLKSIVNDRGITSVSLYNLFQNLTLLSEEFKNKTQEEINIVLRNVSDTIRETLVDLKEIYYIQPILNADNSTYLINQLNIIEDFNRDINRFVILEILGIIKPIFCTDLIIFRYHPITITEIILLIFLGITIIVLAISIILLTFKLKQRIYSGNIELIRHYHTQQI